MSSGLAHCGCHGAQPGHEPNKRKLKPNAVIPLREELQKWADAPKATNSKYAKSDSQR